MTSEEQIMKLQTYKMYEGEDTVYVERDDVLKILEQKPIDKSAMMYEIYMKGVNMTGEYQGCWVRFKDIEKIVDKYIEGSDSE